MHDFNGDGIADLAVATGDSQGVGILLGKVDGTFGTAVTYSIYSPITALAVEDFNGDGKADLAVAVGYSSQFLEVLLGNGNGTFQPGLSYSTGIDNVSMVVGDFNGDGKADLLLGPPYTILLGGAAPDLAIAASHGGGLTQGQQGAEYTVTVSNVGDWASSGPAGVVIALPAGLTATSLAGNGWTCTLATLACTRTDALAAAASYPAIVLKVNVAGGLTGNVTSVFSVSGGGDQNPANNSCTDTTLARTSTSVTLTSSPNPSVLGRAVTLTATVTAGATGNVVFYDGVTALGSAALSAGQSVFTTSLLLSGARYLSAFYTGDSKYGPSTSATRTQTVTAAPANGTLPPTSYPVTALWMATGDFNRDGKTDLVTAGNGSGGSGASMYCWATAMARSGQPSTIASGAKDTSGSAVPPWPTSTTTAIRMLPSQRPTGPSCSPAKATAPSAPPCRLAHPPPVVTS